MDLVAHAIKCAPLSVLFLGEHAKTAGRLCLEKNEYFWKENNLIPYTYYTMLKKVYL